jgi:ABC-2 type transport system ATP-binding protein
MNKISLEVERLSFSYPSFSVREVSFQVPAGTTVGLLGQNGAGKTTTLKAIMGLLRKSSGTARAGGMDHALDEKAFRSRVGFVAEDFHFYSRMPVGRLLRFAASFYPRWDRGRETDLLGRLQIDPSRLCGELSKGMRTKLSLIVALAHDPEVLLLDEPSAGLDPASRVELFQLLEELRERGTGILFSTHLLEEVERLATRIVLLHDGRVMDDRDMTELRAASAATQAGPAQVWSLERYYLGRIGRGTR